MDNYLVVRFYDNDFGPPMLEALERLWTWIFVNDSDLITPQVYRKLFDCGALQSMVLRLFVLEKLCREVEVKIHDLHRTTDWGQMIIENPSHLTDDTYLKCEVSLHETQDTIKDLGWANSECAFLEIDTGLVGIF